MSEAVSVQARCKWFNQQHGYGFLVSDMLTGDVMIHHSKLTEHGCKSVPPGTVLEVTTEQGERGLLVDRVLNIDYTYAEPEAKRSRSPKATVHQLIEPAGEWEPVEVKWFHQVKGYGFLSREDGTDVFIHADQLVRAGLREQAIPGAAMQARIGRTAKGWSAVAVRPAGNWSSGVAHRAK